MLRWSWFVVSALFTTTVCSLADDDSRGSQLPIQTSCEVDHTEIVYPSISTTRGNSSHSWEVGTRLPRSFHVGLRWRGRQRRLTLFESDVAAENVVVVYSDDSDNDTSVADTEQDRCYYHGFLKGERSSYAAVSTCAGLAGYIQTDEEMLFIEPASAQGEGSGHWDRQPHIMYTCQQRESPSGNSTDTGEPEPVPTADPRPRRRRRSTGRKRYLEVMLVVDHTVVAMHGKDRVKNYVLTLMNIANSVYQHHTLGVNLRVVVTEIILLDKEEQKQVVVKRDAYGTVHQFCQWTMYRQPSPWDTKHDIAVLLTREKMGPAGYAPISGLCNPSRSCAAITDEGFTSGFIIAHEMAHVFGLFHDGHRNPCSGRRYMSAIMAPLVEAKLNHFWWSECSKQTMQHVINYLYCLNDEPDMLTDVNHYELDTGPELPRDMGKHWSLDFQCQLEFGDRVGLCRSFPSDQCNMLWCSDRSTPHLCRTKRGPPAPGTKCGQDRECRNFQCTYVGNEKPVNGNWSSWSNWEPCSVDCGTGVRRRSRYCTYPKPAYGGKECEGEAQSWDTCVAKDCGSYYDPREGQCAVWNDMRIRSGQHDWKPYLAKKESDRCKQTCISSQTREVVTIDVEVMDGTPCDYDDPTNICFLGKCLAVGCDGVRNSTKVYDSCGICGGDNSQCKNVSGLFKRVPAHEEEYESVVFLPKGSRNINIVKTGKTKHFIALKDAAYGTYPLNGEKRQEHSQQFIYSGARFEYTSKPEMQSLTSRGPLHTNLEVMLYPAKDKSTATVTYDYSINKDDYTLERRKYQWRFKEWSDCSVTCGEGVTTIVHACHDKDTGDRVEDEKCQHVDPPRKDTASCSRESCSQRKYIWAMTNDWSECSAMECGEEGEQTQGYICQLFFMNNDTYQDVDLQLCDQKTAPTETRICTAPPCPDLSLTTGGGSELNPATDTSTASVTNDYNMNKDDSALERRKYEWFFQEWSDCSVTCGEGVTTTVYACYDKDTGDRVEDEKCQHLDPLRKDTALCSREPCLQTKYIWAMTDDWSECSAMECGEEGEQTQGYICQLFFMNNNSHQDVDLQFCDQKTAPKETRNCSASPCPELSWVLGDWSECSVTCGKGRQSRRVYCGDPDTDSDDIFCKEAPPPLSRSCKKKRCKGARNGNGCKDKYSFCAQAKGLSFKCKSKRFEEICCKSCRRVRRSARLSRRSRRPKNKRRFRRRRYY